MRRSLYIDNFRGFTDTYVPLADVNFLVGQNSTGKTSLLGLLRILSSQRLFMGPEFGEDDVQFGHFNEMVSAHSDDRSYFRIGLAEERPLKDKAAPLVSAILLTYTESGGLPQIARLTCSIAQREVHLRFEGERLLYKSIDRTEGIPFDDLVPKLMPEWIRDHRSSETAHWTDLSLPPGVSGQMPLFMVLTWALQSSLPKDERLPKEVVPGFPFFLPQFGPQLVWVAPIRSKPRRTYDEPHTVFSSEGSHAPYVIRRMLASEIEAKKFTEFIQRVGKASGLFQSIEIKRFGQPGEVTAPFEVDVVLDDKALNLSTVGYGVSQALPILVELLDRPAASWFAIQQPEVHLHPRAQAALGDVFFEMSANDQKCFLIETHSDFMIDRFRMNYTKKVKRKPTSQVLFFERKKKHNTVTSLPVGKRGGLPSSQPNNYRDFFIREEMRLLGI